MARIPSRPAGRRRRTRDHTPTLVPRLVVERRTRYSRSYPRQLLRVVVPAFAGKPPRARARQPEARTAPPRAGHCRGSRASPAPPSWIATASWPQLPRRIRTRSRPRHREAAHIRSLATMGTKSWVGVAPLPHRFGSGVVISRGHTDRTLRAASASTVLGDPHRGGSSPRRPVGGQVIRHEGLAQLPDSSTSQMPVVFAPSERATWRRTRAHRSIEGGRPGEITASRSPSPAACGRFAGRAPRSPWRAHRGPRCPQGGGSTRDGARGPPPQTS